MLQIAFGWANYRAHVFEVKYAEIETHGYFDRLTVMRIETTIGIEEAFDFLEEGDAEPVHERSVRLADVYEKAEWKGKVHVRYDYDFGDG